MEELTRQKKTKIICTLGPNSDNPDIMRGLAENGMDVARFNFSHGSYSEHKARLEETKPVILAGQPSLLLMLAKESK